MPRRHVDSGPRPARSPARGPLNWPARPSVDHEIRLSEVLREQMVWCPIQSGPVSTFGAPHHPSIRTRHLAHDLPANPLHALHARPRQKRHRPATFGREAGSSAASSRTGSLEGGWKRTPGAPDTYPAGAGACGPSKGSGQLIPRRAMALASSSRFSWRPTKSSLNRSRALRGWYGDENMLDKARADSSSSGKVPT